MPPSRREYTAGNRNQRFRRITKGQYVEERRAWVTTLLGQMALYIYPEGTEIAEASNEPGPTVKVLIPRFKGPAIHWDLSALTMMELDALREFFTLAFAEAEPVIRMRDQVAHDALTEGNDSFSRIYRQLPQLVVRKGTQREHGQGIQHRPENVPSGESIGDTSGGVRGPSGGMADDGAEEGGIQDDGATPD